MKTIIHVDQHVIKANTKSHRNDPPLSVKTYKGTKKCHSIHIEGDSEVVYSPDKPLSCGARVWIETQGKVTMWDNQKQKQVQ